MAKKSNDDYHCRKGMFYFPNRDLTIKADDSGLDHDVTFSVTTGSKKVYYRDNNGSLRRADALLMKVGLSISYQSISVLITSWDSENQCFNYQIKQKKED